ncbi:MAG TPA: MFS transporter [Candidatus Paenibacillus intestinavium]|nr:MFS transporter [Candidatus Paenibacillus intestinavium]
MTSKDGTISRKNWMNIWVFGLVGQLCWNIENSWFNTFVYDKIAKDPSIISWMVAISAIVSTIATFIIGTWSDRAGKRKPFIAIGYIFWGIFTISFGLTEFMPKSPLIAIIVFVIAADAIMSFFGSMGYDASFQPWTTDISNERNRGKLGGVFAALPVIATIFGAVVSGIIVEKFDFFPFFIMMGGLVMVIGLWGLWSLRDHPNLKPRKNEGGYWKQVAEVFSIRTVIGNRELFWVFVVNAVFFSGFNIYFPYITIYFNNYLGMDYGAAGVIQGVGLIAALFLTIPAAKLINRGKMTTVISIAIVSNIVGLIIITLNSSIIGLLIGIFFSGIGFVLVMQSITAWVKNLFPEDQRGQFEGIRMIFGVCVPMIIGPLIAKIVIENYGIYMEIDGVVGAVPTESLFVTAAMFTILTFLPLIPAGRFAKSRFQK